MLRLVALVSFLAASLTACVTMTPIDQKLLDKDLTRSYPAPQSKCFAATLGALKDFGTPVESADPKAGKIMTERVEAVRVVTASHSQYSSVGQVNVAHHRYFMTVSGKGDKCTVKTTKYQVWQNNIELTEINRNWADVHLWTPLFKGIQDRLGVAALDAEPREEPVYY